jgi:hypothetical protein
MSASAIDLHLHRKQGEAFLSGATEILYGGAAGGGKSHLMRSAAITWCAEIPGLQVYLFRRISEDLVKNHIEGPKGLRAILAPWANGGLVRMVEDEIRFWNGSKIYLCHCKDEKDRFKYLGAEIHVLLIDELTTFTDTIYRFLRSRVRAVGLNLPKKYEGMFPRVLCGSNPGNIGHHWVKAGFIDAAVPLEIRPMPDGEGGMLRQYIPAKLDDNPSMAADDPKYRQRLRGLGSPQLVKAMEDGDWNVVAGAFFPEFSTERHVVNPIALPETWHRFRACDWGSAKPFSVGWYAVSDGDLPQFPRGALIKYREWYGMEPGQPNVGLKMTAEEVADGIVERDDPGFVFKWPHSVIDPSAMAENGGPSISERMLRRTKKRVAWREADNKRVAHRGAIGGWDQVRSRLIGTCERDSVTNDVLWDTGSPMLFLFSTCVHTIRTLPALQHDDAKPEDVDSDGEDHAPDETRYACVSRPYLRKLAAPEVNVTAALQKAHADQMKFGRVRDQHFEARRRAREEMSV